MIKQVPFYILMLSVVVVFTACSSAVSEKKQDRCEGLNEDQCLASAECRGVYGPSKCYDNGMCTEDLAFKGCKQMSVEVLERGRVDRQLCEDTGGLWDINFYTKPGTCQCKNRMMIKDKGCAVLKKSAAPAFLQQYCKEFENTGEWYCDDLDKYRGGVEAFRERCESIGYEYEYNAKAYFADQMGVCAKR